MSVPVAAQASTVKVLFDGQSLNWSPSVSDNYPKRLMQSRGIHSSNVAVSGFAWIQLRNLISNRVEPYLQRAPVIIVIGLGGTTDYALNRTGAQVYGYEVDWANNIRSATSNTVYVIQTTTTPSTSFTGPQDTERIAGNALVIADASGAFDYSVDLAGDARLSNPSNTTYYNPDGTHLTAAGAQVVADLITPSFEAILASI